MNVIKKVDFWDKKAVHWRLLAKRFCKLEPYKESSEYGLKCLNKAYEATGTADKLRPEMYRILHEKDRKNRRQNLIIGFIICLIVPNFAIFWIMY